MSELKSMFNGCVLMSDSAINDQAIMNVLKAQSNNNFEFKNTSCDHVTFDEFIGKGN